MGPTFHFNSIFLGRCSSLENSGGWGQTRIAADCNNLRNQGLNKRKLSKKGLNKRRPRAQSQMWSSSLFPLCLQPYTHMDFAHHTYKDFTGESLNRKRGSFVRQLCTDYRTKITECPQKKNLRSLNLQELSVSCSVGGCRKVAALGHVQRVCIPC